MIERHMKLDVTDDFHLFNGDARLKVKVKGGLGDADQMVIEDEKTLSLTYPSARGIVRTVFTND